MTMISAVEVAARPGERQMIRQIVYASCYVYSPTGVGAVCERSRLLRTLLKVGDAGFMLKYALRVRQQARDSPLLMGFFGAEDVLVPVPGSTPHVAGSTWPAGHLTAALISEGLGAAAWLGLRRVGAVTKSATAAPGARPTVGRHYESFLVESTPNAPSSIVIVDDVVTKGRTLLAAASRLHETFPHARIRAFALLRTMGLGVGVQQLLDPCKGEIRWRGGDANRRP